MKKDTYLGFEDFCVLNGKTSGQKYQGSYESIAKRIKDFVSPEHMSTALENFFKILTLSCVIRNGDAHLKNFGVLYNDPEGVVKLAPAYDLVSTTPYNKKDILALTLGGSKNWPNAKTLVAFAHMHCNITNEHAKNLMNSVFKGVLYAIDELNLYINEHQSFKNVGTLMLEEWKKGLKLTS